MSAVTRVAARPLETLELAPIGVQMGREQRKRLHYTDWTGDGVAKDPTAQSGSIEAFHQRAQVPVLAGPGVSRRPMMRRRRAAWLQPVPRRARRGTAAPRTLCRRERGDGGEQRGALAIDGVEERDSPRDSGGHGSRKFYLEEVTPAAFRGIRARHSRTARRCDK